MTISDNVPHLIQGRSTHRSDDKTCHSSTWPPSLRRGLRLCCLQPSLPPISCLFLTQVLFCSAPFLNTLSPSLTGEVPPGCNSGPKPNLAASRRERLTMPCCRKINTPISSEAKSNNSHYPEWLSATFSLCVAWRAAFGILFHGFSFCLSGVDLGRRMQKSTGKGGGRQKEKKGRERSKSVTQTPVSEPAFHHHERERSRPPRHRRMSSKRRHYEKCHLFLNRWGKTRVSLL